MRRYLGTHGGLALALVAATLLARILIPGGFMPVARGHGVVVQMCTGAGAMTVALPVAEAPGKADHGADRKSDSRGASPCAFSGLGAPSLAGADPVLLGVALLFVLAAGLRPESQPVPRAVRRLRPPLRGPPVRH